MDKTIFPETLETCLQIFRDIQKEAEAERWKGVKPEFFYIKNDDTGVSLCLDYVEDGIYKMQFCIGVSKNGFSAPRTDKYIDITYKFLSIAEDEKIRQYYIDENLEFCKYADFLLTIPFSWKSLLFHSEDGACINTMRDYAFQKFCLFLDIMIPLKNYYVSEKPLITDAMQTIIDEVSKSFDLELKEDGEPNHIFTNGHYKIES